MFSTRTDAYVHVAKWQVDDGATDEKVPKDHRSRSQEAVIAIEEVMGISLHRQLFLLAT